MARTINFDFSQGGGTTLTEGRLTLAGTQIYTDGTTVVLPDTVVTAVVGGLASIPNVEPTPTDPTGWRYQVKVETYSGTVHRWIVELPDGTAPIDFAILPVIEATTLPLDATGTQLEVWFTSVRAQAVAANTNATNALNLIQQYHGGVDSPTPFKSVDSWEQKKIVTYGDGTVKAIPFGDMAPGTPATPGATPGSTMITVTWTLVAPASNVTLLRNGVVIYTGTDIRYVDKAVVDGVTYYYSLIAYDQWGQRSVTSASVMASVNAALNMPPTVQVTTWPAPLPSNGSGIIRVCGADPEAQSLALALNVSVGQISPTQDPSIWTFTA